MSKMLNLADSLLSTSRALKQHGRSQQAIDLLTRLVRFGNVPAATTEAAHHLLADLYFQNDEYRKARRHLTIALSYPNGQASDYFKMASILEADPDARPERARAYYRQALKRDRTNAAGWTDYGIYLFAIGERRDGVKALRRAAKLSMHDANRLGQIASSLRQEGLFELSKVILNAAYFQNHGARRFAALLQEHRFHLLSEKQQRSRSRQAAKIARPSFLPFAPGTTQGTFQNLGGKTLRLDRAAPLREPKLSPRLPFQRPS